LWRRSQEIEATPDEAEYLLDLAAFADHRLDDDETARVAALIVRDDAAAADVAAARLLADSEMTAADTRTVIRAAALVDDSRAEARVIAFPSPARAATPWFSAATWSGLAAAIVLAGWVGFDLGSGISASSAFGRAIDDMSASEVLDPAPLLPRDFTENSQI
jgi:anti-sigma factor RsiW